MPFSSYWVKNIIRALQYHSTLVFKEVLDYNKEKTIKTPFKN